MNADQLGMVCDHTQTKWLVAEYHERHGALLYWYDSYDDDGHTVEEIEMEIGPLTWYRLAQGTNSQ